MIHATAGQTVEGKGPRVGIVGRGCNVFIGAVHRHLAKVRIDVVVLDLDSGERYRWHAPRRRNCNGG